jgi:hypothetical protein
MAPSRSHAVVSSSSGARVVGSPGMLRSAEFAVRRWNLSQAQIEKAKQVAENLLDSEDEARREGAVRLLLAIAEHDRRLARDATERDLSAAALQLQAHLAALAADPSYASAIAALPVPRRLEGTAAPDDPAPAIPAMCPLAQCDGSGVIVNERGAYPCDCARPERQERSDGRRGRIIGGRTGDAFGQ